MDRCGSNRRLCTGALSLLYVSLLQWDAISARRFASRTITLQEFFENAPKLFYSSLRTIFQRFIKMGREGFNNLLEPTPFYLLLWEIFNFYNPDRKSDEFSELYAPDLHLDKLRTKNKRNGKSVKKRSEHFDCGHS